MYISNNSLYTILSYKNSFFEIFKWKLQWVKYRLFYSYRICNSHFEIRLGLQPKFWISSYEAIWYCYWLTNSKTTICVKLLPLKSLLLHEGWFTKLQALSSASNFASNGSSHDSNCRIGIKYKHLLQLKQGRFLYE